MISPLSHPELVEGSVPTKILAIAGGAFLFIIIAIGIPAFHMFSDAARVAAFSKVEDSKPPLTAAEVEQLMGRPTHIEQSQTADQTITGEVYHYPYHGSDMKIVFVNGTVFHAEYIPGTKS